MGPSGPRNTGSMCYFGGGGRGSTLRDQPPRSPTSLLYSTAGPMDCQESVTLSADCSDVLLQNLSGLLGNSATGDVVLECLKNGTSEVEKIYINSVVCLPLPSCGQTTTHNTSLSLPANYVS